MLVNRNNYILKEIPKLSPVSMDYIDFWREQKYKSLYGMWSGGYWIPGWLYHYVNLWKIEIKETETAKSGKIGRPFFRDIDYDFSLAYTEARGFSRFEKQTLEEVAGKKPRDIMTAWYPNDMGRPLFENEAKNIILITNRGLGKSFWMAHSIGIEWLHGESGQKKEIVVGAGDSKFSSDLLKKVRIGIEHLPGDCEYNGDYYPPPFYKRARGSFQCGKSYEAKYEAYRGNNKIWKGDGSSIKHVSYQVDEFAGQGTRPVLQVYEEIGMFNGFEKAWNNNIETVMYGTKQFGTQIGAGTGGDMTGGTIDVSRMFYSPDTYNCVEFEDSWEGRGRICMFIPASRGLNEFKDENGISKIQEATEFLIKRRNELKDSGAAKSKIDKEVQYRPLKPSEAFLISSGNIFPQVELQDQLDFLERDPDMKGFASVGDLFFDESGNVCFKPNPKRQEITKFPLESHDDSEGAIVIFEHPEHDAPRGLYISGLDPYDHDKSQTGSLGSLIVYKRFKSFDSTYDFPVAEYTGRPEVAEEYYENVRMMLMYYNAKCLYENERKGIHQYFEMKGCTHLLLDQPMILDDIIKNSKVDRKKGIHMTQQIKDYAERRLNSWLREEYAPGKKNLRKLYSRALVTELLKYNDGINADRTIAFMMVMLMRDEMHKQKVKEVKKESATKFFDINLFVEKPKF